MQATDIMDAKVIAIQIFIDKWWQPVFYWGTVFTEVLYLLKYCIYWSTVLIDEVCQALWL